MVKRQGGGARQRLAEFRFAIIAPLFCEPPEHGELRRELQRLAARTYTHPLTGETVDFRFSTLERWYYVARGAREDRVAALARRVHGRAGQHPSMSVPLADALRIQYRQHPSWSYQLHYDNLVAQAVKTPTLGEPPSYATVRRYMKSKGWTRRKRKRRQEAENFAPREQRSYEAPHVNSLWHVDFHEGSRAVLMPEGRWVKPWLFGCLDDRSRVCCHAQWYLVESVETFVHGFIQALLKREMPGRLMSDRGGAFLAAEATQGLSRLGIEHWPTLPNSPEQNGKQENFWAQVEGRLIPMLEGHTPLTLDLLNHATQAWVELEYQHHHHDELGESPMDVFKRERHAGHPCPDSLQLHRALRQEVDRTQRRSDGTISVQGVRFELPSRFRSLTKPTVRFARWDLSSVDLMDPHSGQWLCALYPLDKQANADGRRRTLAPQAADALESEVPQGIAPLLEQHMADYAATGLPPAYLPLHDVPAHEIEEP